MDFDILLIGNMKIDKLKLVKQTMQYDLQLDYQSARCQNTSWGYTQDTITITEQRVARFFFSKHMSEDAGGKHVKVTERAEETKASIYSYYRVPRNPYPLTT